MGEGGERFIIVANFGITCVGHTKTEMPGVVSVFPNRRRTLHTTHSWDFMGLSGEETMEIPGYSTKNQVNVIIGFIDTGIWPESPSFNDAGMPPVPKGWKGECQSGEGFNVSTCNRSSSRFSNPAT